MSSTWVHTICTLIVNNDRFNVSHWNILNYIFMAYLFPTNTFLFKSMYYFLAEKIIVIFANSLPWFFCLFDNGSLWNKKSRIIFFCEENFNSVLLFQKYIYCFLFSIIGCYLVLCLILYNLVLCPSSDTTKPRWEKLSQCMTEMT